MKTEDPVAICKSIFALDTYYLMRPKAEHIEIDVKHGIITHPFTEEEKEFINERYPHWKINHFLVIKKKY
jgi:hypothetical protein